MTRPVQFETEENEVIVAVFGNSQDPVAYPHQGEVSEDDPRYIKFLSDNPTIAEALS